MAGWSGFDCFWLRFHALNETSVERLLGWGGLGSAHLGQAGLKVARFLFDVLGQGWEKSSVMSCLYVWIRSAFAK